jgi:ribonucleoside-diphosphate reductase beta chain
MEQLEDPKFSRLFIIPDINNPIFSIYKKLQENFWIEEEIDTELKKDEAQFQSLDPKIKKLVKFLVAFFVVGDGRVNDTISEHFDSKITDRELLTMYNWIKANEDTHNLTYVRLADAYIKDKAEKDFIFNSVENYPVIRNKINWVKKWLGEGNEFHKLSNNTINSLKEISKRLQATYSSLNVDSSVPELDDIVDKLNQKKVPLAMQILVNIIMEGLFFQGVFCIIFWMNSKGILPGLCKANEFISRDEGVHTDLGIYVYNFRIQNKLPQKIVHTMFQEAIDIQIDFLSEALPTGLPGIDTASLTQYVKYIADKLLTELQYEKIYNTTNPFNFSMGQSISVRMTDFFMDSSVSEYGHHASGTKAEDQSISFSDDF